MERIWGGGGTPRPLGMVSRQARGEGRGEGAVPHHRLELLASYSRRQAAPYGKIIERAMRRRSAIEGAGALSPSRLSSTLKARHFVKSALIGTWSQITLRA